MVSVGGLVGWLIDCALDSVLVFKHLLHVCSKKLLQNSLCFLLGFTFFFRSLSLYCFLFLHSVMMLFKGFSGDLLQVFHSIKKLKNAF